MEELRACKRSVVKDLLCGVVDGLISVPRGLLSCMSFLTG